MPGPDASAKAALSASLIHPCYVGWLDFVGDPLRVTTAPYSVTFASTGDAELDGFTFAALSPELINISQVTHRDQGSETVTASLSGIITLDDALLSLIATKSNWQGRTARLWLMMYDTAFNRVGNVWGYYTGYMSSVGIKGSPGTGTEQPSQTVDISIESYLASFSEPSNRTYLDQTYYDPGDLSAEASIAIANGKSGAALSDSLGGAGMREGGPVGMAAGLFGNAQ